MEICRDPESFSSGHDLENYPISFQCHYSSKHYHHEKRKKIEKEKAAERIKTRKYKSCDE